jgi:hypothetical protein
MINLPEPVRGETKQYPPIPFLNMGISSFEELHSSQISSLRDSIAPSKNFILLKSHHFVIQFMEDQQYLQEIIHRRLVDAKRTAIVSRAKQAKTNVRKHNSRNGTAKDLLADLNG